MLGLNVPRRLTGEQLFRDRVAYPQSLYELERVDDQVEHDRVGRAFLYAEFPADAGQGKRGLGLADPHRENRLAVGR